MAGVARAGALDLQRPRDAGEDFLQRKLQVIAEVRAPTNVASVRGGAAEEGVEDVGKAAEGVEQIAARGMGPGPAVP